MRSYTCPKCKKLKPAASFYLTSKNKKCKGCTRAYQLQFLGREEFDKGVVLWAKKYFP